MRQGHWLGLAVGAALLLPGAALAQTAAGHPPFDVEAATRAYLDLLQGPARARSDAYFEGGCWLILWDAAVAVIVYGIMLATGLSARLRDWAERVTRRRWLQPALYSVPFTIVSTLLLLPWTIYEGFVREDQYGLMNQSFSAWLTDQAKAMGVSVVVSALLFMAIFAVIRRFPRGWWAWGAGVVTLFFAIEGVIAPVFLAPLFNSYSELPRGPLRDRIVAVAQANGIPAEHIYVSDASRQTRRISANVSGFGPTVRITLNDNLLHRAGPDEVVAILGHEMGHYVMHYLLWLIGEFAVIFTLALFAVARIAPLLIARFPRWRVRSVADPAVAPVLFGLAAVATMILTPVQNNFVRSNETAADIFGLDAARQPDGFAMAAIQLAQYRKLEPGPIEEFLFYDHPSGYHRIRRAMQWKHDHVPDARMVRPVMPTS